MIIAMAMRVVVSGPPLDASLEDGNIESAVMEVGSVMTEVGAGRDTLLGVLVEDGVSESVGVGTLPEDIFVIQVSGKRTNTENTESIM